MSFCYYSLNHADVVDEIGGDWASEDADQRSWSGQVVGTKLWKHINGQETKSYLNAIFFAVRQSKEVIILPYRCDSLLKPKHCLMAVIPQQNGGLTIDHIDGPVLTHVQVASQTSKYDAHSTKRCSICCAFKIGSEWIDPHTLPNPVDFPKGLGVCPACKSVASNRISGGMRISGGHDAAFQRLRSSQKVESPDV